MRRLSIFALTLSVVFGVGAAIAFSPAKRNVPEDAKPGPEHEILKKRVGTWDAEMNMGNGNQHGVMTYTMGPGDLWLISDIKFDFFTGHGIDGYDINKKQYIGTWVDSSNTAILTMESTYDKETKTMTTIASGTGMDGKPAKSKITLATKDDDHMTFKMAKIVDGKDTEEFTISYTRKK